MYWLSRACEARESYERAPDLLLDELVPVVVCAIESQRATDFFLMSWL